MVIMTIFHFFECYPKSFFFSNDKKKNRIIEKNNCSVKNWLIPRSFPWANYSSSARSFQYYLFYSLSSFCSNCSISIIYSIPFSSFGVFYSSISIMKSILFFLLNSNLDFNYLIFWNLFLLFSNIRNLFIQVVY